MPQGDKSAYTDRQKRKARHIEEGYERSGVSEGEAERRAWATVNKQEGGGRKSGRARGTARRAKSAKRASGRTVKRGTTSPSGRAASPKRRTARRSGR